MAERPPEQDLSAVKNPAYRIETDDPTPYLVHQPECGCDNPAADGDHHFRVSSIEEIEDGFAATWWFRPREHAGLTASPA